MGEEKDFAPVKLFCGVIYQLEAAYEAVRITVQEMYSPVDLESEIFPFTYTDYYHAEMGSPLFRRFMSFTELISPERLPEIKLATNHVERETVEEGRRRVNLDPGILSDANVIIATTKNYYHRVALRSGIYAHLEYVYRGGHWHPLEWTYPDFRTETYMDFFLRLRDLYKKQRRK